MARIAKPNTTPTQSETKAYSKRKADWDAIVDDRTFDSFVVRTVKPTALNRSAPANKKRKTAKGAVDALAESTFSQRNPIKESDLSSVLYQIEPADVWARLDKYRRFTIEAEQFELNQYVFIKHGLDAGPSTTEVKDWVAKVLEVRGADSAHVFLRVAWMYRPEDLPGGRQPHHGACELVASNHIDVVDAKSVQHVADVIHWPDEDDDDEVPYQDQLFWRQSLDVTLSKSKRLSKLQNHCIDKAPRNPDEDLVYCPSCKTWLHARCLQDEAIKDASSSNSSTRQSFTATIRTLRSGKTALTVTDLRKSQNHRKWNVDVTCLKCNDIIERAKPYSEDDEDDDDDGEELENAIGDNVTVTPASPTPGASSDDDSAVHLKHTEQAEDLSTTGSVNQDAATTESIIEMGATTS